MPDIEIPTEQLQRFAFADLASGRMAKTKSDASKLARQAIVVIGVDYWLRVFLLSVWAGRIATSAFTKRLLDTYERWEPRVFGIEANAMQSLYADTVRDAAKEKLKRSNFLPVTQNTRVDKDWRIVTTLEPLLSEGRLFHLDEQLDFYEELRGHPTARTKDVIDALASAIMLIPRRPMEKRKSEEEVELAAYMRRSGCSPQQIKDRVEAIRRGDNGRWSDVHTTKKL